jgi:FMN phosphatase YigB (HAD superfamily)
MGRIRVVSFDMEGTLIDHNFSDLFWETDIPTLYGRKHGLDLETARERVISEYKQIGDERPEWYDAGYWFTRLGLEGDIRELLNRRREDCRVYPETRPVLERLSGRYPLIISSNTMREFLDVQLLKLPPIFDHVFSATSDFGMVKKSEDFYRRICQMLGVPSNEVAHIGDNQRFDYEAAKKAGVNAYHLDRTGDSEGAHAVRDLTEFEERLKNLE